MTLPLDVSRCAGWYGSDQGDGLCHERMSCQRYMAWIKWDAEADIQNYEYIPVSMAVRDCEHKIEVEEE